MSDDKIDMNDRYIFYEGADPANWIHKSLYELGMNRSGEIISHMVKTGDIENIPNCSNMTMERTVSWAISYELGEVIDNKFIANQKGLAFAERYS